MSNPMKSRTDTAFYALAIVASFVIGGVFAGFVTSDAFKRNTLSGSIGAITSRNQIGVGTWFRYDPYLYQGADSAKFYIIANATEVIYSGDPDKGDKAVTEIEGNIKWYTWSLKAYWFGGSEATELYDYPNGGSGIQLWDYCARYLWSGYKNRLTYTKTIALNKTTTDGPLRPMFPQSQTSASAASSNSSVFIYAYQTDKLWITYELQTNILFSIEAWANGGAQAFRLASWSPSTPITVEPTKPTVSIELEKETVASYEYKLKITTTSADRVDLNVTSSDELKLTSFNASTSSNTVPINIDDAPVNITVTAKAWHGKYISSTLFNKTFLLDYVKTSAVQVPKTTITNATQINNSTIRVTWGKIDAANEYRIFINGSYFDKTQNTSYDYHPSKNGTYGFIIVCDSFTMNKSSKPSDMVSATFAKSEGTFFSAVEEDKTFTVVEEDNTTFIVLAVVLIGSIVAGFMFFNNWRCTSPKGFKKDVGCGIAIKSKKQGGK